MLHKTNTFISLNSPFESSISWFNNYSKIEDAKKEKCIAFVSRDSNEGCTTLDDLDPRQLYIDTTIEEKFNPQKLINLLKIYLQNSRKIAIVDRHNYLTTGNDKPSLLVDFVKELLIVAKSSKCHEIIIYAKYDPNKYPYMISNESLKAELTRVFHGCITPTYWIKYIFCS